MQLTAVNMKTKGEQIKKPSFNWALSSETES